MWHDHSAWDGQLSEGSASFMQLGTMTHQDVRQRMSRSCKQYFCFSLTTHRTWDVLLVAYMTCKLHFEFLNDLHSSPNIVPLIKSRRMRWAGHIAHMGERRGVYRVLVGKPEGKRPLGRPRRRWQDNTSIKIDLQEVGCGVWTKSSLFRIGTGGGHLWMR